MSPNMRVVKLSPKEFSELGNVREFFQSELDARNPQGKFCVTEARISRRNGLAPNDYLVFTYKGRIVFTARSGSRLLPNTGRYRETHPYYFVVALDTLCETDVDVEEFERRHNQRGVRSKNVATSQGWNILPASADLDDLWTWLRA
jgi:hypothetical protein